MGSNAKSIKFRILSVSVMRKKEPKILFAIFKLLSMACVSSSSSNSISFPPLINEKQNDVNESIDKMQIPIIRSTFKTGFGVWIGCLTILFTIPSKKHIINKNIFTIIEKRLQQVFGFFSKLNPENENPKNL
jgi:hypothetical protein